MRELLVALAVLIATATTARASEQSGPTLGLRSGIAMPLGSAGDNADLDRLTSGAFPIELEVGWRFDRRWLAGAYFSWGPTMVATDAKGALAASGATGISGHAVQRLGVEALYSLFQAGRFDQWVGLGLGYEWNRFAEARLPPGTPGTSEIGLQGWEATLQIGGDYRVSRGFAVGPFASASFGQYRSRISSVDATAPDTSASRAIADKGVHEWLQLGIRAKLDL